MICVQIIMIHFGALYFSEWHYEEVIRFLMVSVYSCNANNEY